MNDSPLFELFEKEPAMRRLHYLNLSTELRDCDLFTISVLGTRKLKLPATLYLEVGGEMTPIGIYATAGANPYADDLLEWLVNWASGRRLVIATRMWEMRERWPDLPEQYGDDFDDQETEGSERERGLWNRLKRAVETVFAGK